MARVLWLSGEYLIPADSGLYRYSLDMLDALVEFGHDVEAIGRARSEDASGPPAPDHWTLLPHRSPSMVRKVLDVRPAKVVEVWDDDYAAAVSDAIDRFDPEIVLFDHLRVGAALDVIAGRVPSIYVSQNDETRVKEKMVAAAKGVRKLALWQDLAKIRRFEDRLLRECAGVSAISTADIATFCEREPDIDVVHTLPTYRGRRRAQRTITSETPRRVAMISTLYWGAKIDNIVMALRGLQPVIDDGAEVVVFTGGYPPPEEIMAEHPEVVFEGYVEDFDAALDACRVGVVYEPVGGGFKMKTLDFIYHRVPLVTGDTSAESLPLVPGESVEHVHSEAELGRTVGALLDDIERLNSLQNAAFERSRDLFSAESVRDLSDLIDRLTGHSRVETEELSSHGA